MRWIIWSRIGVTQLVSCLIASFSTLAEDDGGFDEQELARLSEQAARRARESRPPAPGIQPSGEPPASGPRRGLRSLLGRGTRRDPFGR